MRYKIRGNQNRTDVVQDDGLVITSHTSSDQAAGMAWKLNNGGGFNGYFPAFWGHPGPVKLS